MLWWCKNLKKIIIIHWTSMLPEITQDGGWPLFQFWRYHLWPKLALSILKFCRSEWSKNVLTGAWDMYNNAQKFEWKSCSKISAILHLQCSYSMVNIAHGKKTFSENLWTERSIAAAKISEKKRKKSLKTHFLTQWFNWSLQLRSCFYQVAWEKITKYNA